MDKTKTISFDLIKKKATQLAVDNLHAWGGPWLSGEDGQGPMYGLDVSFGVLLPSMKEAIAAGRSFGPVHKGMVDDVIARCKSIIDGWDVRQVNRLIDLFPDSVPATCRLRDAKCDYAENGEWAVTFDLTHRRSGPIAPSGAEEIAFNFAAGQGQRLRSMLPDVVRANEAYGAAWDSFEAKAGSGERGAVAKTEDLHAATQAFNKVLGRAMLAFYMDTRAYNHWSTIKQVWGPERHGNDPLALWLVDHHEAKDVVQKLTKMADDLQRGVFESILADGARDLKGEVASEEDAGSESGRPTPRA